MKARITLLALAVASVAACSDPLAPRTELEPPTHSGTVFSSGFGMGSGSLNQTEDAATTESTAMPNSVAPDSAGRGGFTLGSDS
jgi:hypothetical protein